MDLPPPRILLERVGSLPAATPLLQRLEPQPNVYLVGGAVRDLLLDGEPYDLDLVVEGDPAEVAAALGGTVRAHDRFGTASVAVNGFTYDIARSRRETYARPGALPDVVPASLPEDLLRRDFTVNALAIALTGPDPGRLTSPQHGLEDLEAKQLRVLHDASFIDDPTRMLRLARYASRLGFSIEPHTAGLVQPAALHTVSGPRIGTELRLLARERDPVAAVHTLHTLELDRAIHPAFGLRTEHEDADLARRALALLPDDARPDRLALAAAARHLQLPELERLLDELAFEAADRDAIIAAATRAQPLANELAAATKPSEIASAVANAGAAASPKSNPELVALAGALGPASQARAWLDTLQHTRLEIDGADLIAAGVPQGPDIGAGLRAALQAKLDGRASGAQEELEAALRGVKADG